MNEEHTVTDIAQYKSGLDDERHNMLANAFNQITVGLEDALEEAKGIQISGVTDLVNMRKARESRLALRTIRIETENKRKKMKEASLLEGKAIDGMANIVKALVVPVEKDLQEKEDYIQRKEDERIALLVEERKASMAKFEVDCEHFDLGAMKDEAFATLLASSEAGYNARIKAERDEAEAKENAELARRAEEMRLRKAKEEAEAIAEKLRKEKEAAEFEVIQQKVDAEKERKRVELEAQETKRQFEEASRLQHETLNKVMEEDRLKKEAEFAELEAQSQRLRDAEAKRIADEAEAKRVEEQRRLEGSDKDKLLVLIDDIMGVVIPTVSSDAAQVALCGTHKLISELISKLSSVIKEME